MNHVKIFNLTWIFMSLVGMLPARVTADDSKPTNIILIMVDDMGFSDIGCYGGEIETPNLDRLAAEGMRFTQFYNNAKCTTTRASILTGLYPRGMNESTLLRENMLTLGEAMRHCGYETSLSGKWHLGRTRNTHPFHRGFDRFYGLLDGCCNFFDPARPDPSYKGGKVRFFAENDRRITEFPKDFFTTDAFTDHAIQAIRDADKSDKPFFVHLTYTAPHYPIQAKPEDIAKYRGKFKMGWNEMRRQRWDRQKAMGLVTDAWNLSERDEGAYDWESADQDFEDLRMAVYAGMVDCVDQNIGRLLETLKETGHDRDTLIMFLSDNGGCAEEPGGRDPALRTPGPVSDYVAVGPSWGWAQNAPFRRYKSWLHEGGITTPLIAWWPEHIQSNTINRDVAHIIDIMPTFLEIAGSQYPRQYNGHDLLDVEGKSMTQLLRGETRDPHTQLCWFWGGNRAIRQGDWKLVWDKLNNEKKWELYNLADDRCERVDLATKNQDRVVQMANDWNVWAERTELKIKN